jgi:hypothetical protein
MANKIFSILLSVFLAQTVFAMASQQPRQPTLFLAVGEPNGKMVRAEDATLPRSDTLKIVIATHGWFERRDWPQDLALAIGGRVDPNEWLCGWFDWRPEAMVVNPREAAQYARDKAGPLLAQQILKISKNPKHVHLIGHSAGSWVISETAKIIAKETQADIHLTFLDAYVPLGWDSNELGNIPPEPNRVYWADHYLTQDITLKVTDCRLIHAHNIDIGDITPGLKDHKFPYHWYPATVLDRYPPKDKYAGEKLFCTSDDIEYGFARSLEAGKNAWKNSTSLPLGNKPIKINKNSKSNTKQNITY